MSAPMEHINPFKVVVGRFTMLDNSERVRLRFPMAIEELALLPEQAIAIAKDIIKYANEIIEEKRSHPK